MGKSEKGRRSKPDRGKDFVRSALRDGWEDDDTGPVDVLRTLIEEADDPGRDLAELMAYDADPAIAEAAGAVLIVVLQDPDVPSTVAERVGQAAMPVVDRALHDPELPDDRKYMLGPAYMRLGGELSAEELRSCFRDFEGTQQRKLKELLADVSDQPASVEQMFHSLELIDGEPPADEAELFGPLLVLCSDLATGNTGAAAALLGTGVALAIEHGMVAEGASAAVRAMAELACPRAAWCLGELSRWPGIGALGTEARLLAEQMAGSGIQPRATVLSDFSHGILTAVDGSGTRALHLFFRTPEGGMDAVSLMVNDAVGIREAWFEPEEGADVESMFREAPIELTHAPCTLDLAREMLADAWALHEEIEQPFPGRFFICRPYFGEKPILPQRRTPNLGAYMLELVQRTPDLFKGSERLAERAIYGGLFFVSDAGYAYCDQARPRRGRPRLSKKKLDAFITEIAIQGRETLLARMAINLEVESLAGRATQRHNRIAARTWLGITEEVLPFHEIPFIRTLAANSAEMIIENLRHGLRSQAEADAAALEMDDLLGGLLDDDEDDDGFFFGDEP